MNMPRLRLSPMPQSPFLKARNYPDVMSPFFLSELGNDEDADVFPGIDIVIQNNTSLSKAVQLLCQQKQNPNDETKLIHLGICHKKRQNEGLAKDKVIELNNLFGSEWRRRQAKGELAFDIHKVTLDIAMIEANMNSDEWYAVFALCREIAKLPNLEALEWKHESMVVPTGNCILHLTDMLKGCSGLKSLIVEGIYIDGSNSDFIRFAEAIQHHQQVEEVVFKDCRFAPGKQTERNTNPVLQALALTPNLKRLSLDCWTPMETVDDASPYFQLSSHSKLEELDTGKYLLSKEVFKAVANGIANSKTLKSVKTCAYLGKDQCKQLANMVRVNSVLTQLSFTFEAFSKKDEPLTEVLDALGKNKALTTLKLGIQRNGRWKPFSSEFFKKFVTVMERENFTLQEVQFKGISHYDSDDRVNMYAKLNKMGREELMKRPNADSNEWVNMLIEAKLHVDGLYHLLSKNPALCANVNGGASLFQKPNRRRRRYISTSGSPEPEKKRRRSVSRAYSVELGL